MSLSPEEIIHQVETDADALMKAYDISYETGWLAPYPNAELAEVLNNAEQRAWFTLLDKTANMLPELIRKGTVVAAIKKIPVPAFSFDDFLQQSHYFIMLELSMLAHAFFREQLGYKTMAESHMDKSEKELLPQLAVPLWQLHKLTGIDPTMAYWLYGMCNWRKIEKSGSMIPENVTPFLTFTGNETEKWFLAIHHIVEFIKGRAIPFRLRAYLLSQYGDEAPLDYLIMCLKRSANAAMRANSVLGRMEERLDSSTYFKDVRMFYAFPSNVVFLGVDELGGVPQNFEGETGGGSPTHHLDDAVDGIPHRESGRAYIEARRRQMPAGIRWLLGEIDEKSQLRELVLAHKDDRRLVRAFNSNVLAKRDWRLEHDKLVQKSIAQYGDTYGTANPALTLLQDMIEDTEACVIP